MLLLCKVFSVIVLVDCLRAQPMTGRASGHQAVDDDADFYDYFGVKSKSEGDTILLDANQQNPIIRRGDRQYLKPDGEYLSDNIVPDIAPEDDDDGIAMDARYSTSPYDFDSVVDDPSPMSQQEQADVQDISGNKSYEEELVDLSQYQLSESSSADGAHQQKLHEAQVNSAVESFTNSNPYSILSDNVSSDKGSEIDKSVQHSTKSSQAHSSQRHATQSQTSSKKATNKESKSKSKSKNQKNKVANQAMSAVDEDALLEAAIKEAAQMKAEQSEIQEKAAKALVLYHFEQYKKQLKTVIEDKIVDTAAKQIELEGLFQMLLTSKPCQQLIQMQTSASTISVDLKIEAFAGVLYFLDKLRMLVPQIANLLDAIQRERGEIDQYVQNFESESPEFVEITEILKSQQVRVQTIVSQMNTRVEQFRKFDKSFCDTIQQNIPAIMSFVDLRLYDLQRKVQATYKNGRVLDQDYADYTSMEINRALQVLGYIGDENDEVADSISKFRVSSQVRLKKIMLQLLPRVTDHSLD
ncbi:hypothetical protein MIR68_000466 [Amoeboaphelidium protococcarum]|nr:hypothetical protein MIR68_000466 [Amoeboaphelidium protococcarum]